MLFHIDEDEANLLTVGKDKNGRRLEYLKAHPTLVLDTRHFASDFTDRLLASFDNLDEAIDGLLVHSENWQALNLLMENAGTVKQIHRSTIIQMQGFIYKNDYRISWLSMISRSPSFSKEHASGHRCHNEYERLHLLGHMFGYVGTYLGQKNPDA